MQSRTTLVLSLALLLAVLFVVVGCSVLAPKCSVVVPQRQIIVSKEAAHTLETKVGGWKQVGNDTYRLQVTDSEITSYVHYKLADQKLPVTNATVWFQGGVLYLKGDVQLENALHGTVISRLSMRAQDGHLVVNIEKACLGALPLPGQLRSSLSEALNSALDSGMAAEVRVQSINIGTGELTITVKKK